MTQDEERAEQLVRAGVTKPSRTFTCIGCGESVVMEIPGRPEGAHGSLVMADKDGKLGKPVDIWGHPKGKCIGSPILRALTGEGPEASEEEPAATPLRPRRSEKVEEPAEAPKAEASGS